MKSKYAVKISLTEHEHDNFQNPYFHNLPYVVTGGFHIDCWVHLFFLHFFNSFPGSSQNRNHSI